MRGEYNDAPRSGPSPSAAYRRFWQEVGRSFPDLGGAASTAYYLENEKRLLSQHIPDLARCAVFKTDLWDEVKNTRILQWVHEQGAAVFGVDISEPTVRTPEVITPVPLARLRSAAPRRPKHLRFI